MLHRRAFCFVFARESRIRKQNCETAGGRCGERENRDGRRTTAGRTMFGDVFDNSREASGASTSTAAPAMLESIDEVRGEKDKAAAVAASGYSLSPTSSILSSAHFDGAVAHHHQQERASRPEASAAPIATHTVLHGQSWPNERTPINGAIGGGGNARRREFHRIYAYDPWTKRPVVIRMRNVRRFWCWEFNQSGWWIGFSFLVRRRPPLVAPPLLCARHRVRCFGPKVLTRCF